MANFWDLSRPVRDTIYRLHLVKEKQISEQYNARLTKYKRRSTRHQTRRMPAICAVSPKADREAGAIYYGENHFVFGELGIDSFSRVGRFLRETYPRHYRMIRKVTIEWPQPDQRVFAWGGIAREAFLDIGRMSGLRELYIRVDEAEMVRKLLSSRQPLRFRIWSRDTPLSAQDNIAILRHPGMTGLLTLHDIDRVEFVKLRSFTGMEHGGPIPGGVLETQVAPRLRAPRQRISTPGPENDTFPFLSLPPELRNRIYAMLLHVDGDLEPSPRPPSSAPKKCSASGSLPPPGSALTLLGVSHQIHNEAVGIFYHLNRFLFRNPQQLAAFVLSLGDVRASSLRDVTLHYSNIKSGGIDVALFTMPVLKKLTGLRKLHVLCNGDLEDRVRCKYIAPGHCPFVIDGCNPVKVPGMNVLFELRGVTDIKIRDTKLEEEVKKILRKPDGSQSGVAEVSLEESYLKLTLVLDHFNTALADAQLGKINTDMLRDDEWHLRDKFPTIESEPKDAEVEDGDPAHEQGSSKVEFDEERAVEEGTGNDGPDADGASVSEGELQVEGAEGAIPADGAGHDGEGDESVVSLKHTLNPATTDDGAADEIIATGRRTRSMTACAKKAASGTNDQDSDPGIQAPGTGRMQTGFDGKDEEEDSADDEIVGSSKRVVRVEAEEQDKEDGGLKDSYRAREQSVEL